MHVYKRACQRAPTFPSKILVLLAEKERITDNNAVMRFVRRHKFIETEKIENARHELLIEKEEIRSKTLTSIHKFLKLT